MRIGADGPQAAALQPRKQTGHIFGADHRHVEQRPHAAAQRLRIERIDARFDQEDRRRAHCVRRADQRAQVAGILQPVEHQHELAARQLEIGERGGRDVEGGHDALRLIALRQRRHHVGRDGQQLAAGAAEAGDQRLGFGAGELLRAEENLVGRRAGVERHVQQLQAFNEEARAGLAILALAQLARLDDALVAGAGDGGRLLLLWSCRRYNSPSDVRS